MKGRALWWEDGYGIYFNSLGIPWMQKYETDELPVANFVNGIDFSGFQPLNVTTSSGIWGGAIGNDHSILGWFRDSGSEPPDWNLQPTISKQSVLVTIPGSASKWKVDFYDTKDGTTVAGSASIRVVGNTVTIPLPDFHDDIAFKMSALGGAASTLAPVTGNTDAIAGTWIGTITNTASTFSTPIKLFVQGGCEPGIVCGTFSAAQIPCPGDLFLQTSSGADFLFIEQNAKGSPACKPGGYELLQLQADGTLSYECLASAPAPATSIAVLKRQ